MGALLGLTFGVGLLLVWQSALQPRQRTRRQRLGIRQRIADLIAEAGIEAVTPRQRSPATHRAGCRT
jgi:tight adherence protein B